MVEGSQKTARVNRIQTGIPVSHLRLVLLLLVAFRLATDQPAFGYPTDIAIGTTVVQNAVKRLGINLGTVNFYDSGQMMKNLLSRNPGFEGQIYSSIIRCASGTATVCRDENASSAWPTSFWNRSSFEVIWGAARGRTGMVASYSAAAGGRGGNFTFADAGTALAGGDYLIVRQSEPGGATAGWWPVTTGGATITGETVRLREGSSGQQAAQLTALADGQSASLSAYFDTTRGHSFVQLNGTFELAFQAWAFSRSPAMTNPSMQVTVDRLSNPPIHYLSKVVALTSSSRTGYTFTFTAAEKGQPIGPVKVSFSTLGRDSFLLDNVSLTQTDGDPANTTAFRDAVVSALQQLQPGVMRFWALQLGDTLDNLIADPFGRQRAGFSAWSTEQDDISYGLEEFLQLCQTVGAEPWFVVPSTFTTTDAAHLIEFLAGSSTSGYGAKRAARGQVNPWTQSFSKIHLEFGNEEWNGTFKGGSIEYAQPYGSRAQTIFAAMRADAAYLASAFDLVLGGQAVNPGLNQDIQNSCNNNDSFTVGPYMMSTITSFSTNEDLFGSTFAEAEALLQPGGDAEGVTGGFVYLDQQAILHSTHPVPLEVYEVNLSPTGGTITQAALSGYASSVGGGIAVADAMLQQMRQGILTQNLFALPDYQFGRPDGSLVDLWGSVIDMGVTNRKRPQFLAIALANQAIGSGGAMLQTVHSGADPTWNQAMVNTVRLNGAHDLQSFAFANGNTLSLIVFNLNRTSALPVTFSGANAPRGTVQIRQLTSANITDTNELSGANPIKVRSQTLHSPHAIALPPFSMTALFWSR